MVASGLSGDAIYVKPTRLALHFIFAMVLLAYTLWFALKLLTKDNDLIVAPGLKSFTWWIIALLGMQFLFGALMAGHRAAPAAPTWPDINGSFFPPYILDQGLSSIIENRIVIHFIHRMLAYLLTVLIIIWSMKAIRLRASALFAKARALPLFFTIMQVMLGVLTVLTSIEIRAAKWNTFEWMAQLHQFVALLLLLSLVLAAFLLRSKSIKRSPLPNLT
jgi:cytochrome c oxidase assembly protein subunit 15